MDRAKILAELVCLLLIVAGIASMSPALAAIVAGSVGILAIEVRS